MGKTAPSIEPVEDLSLQAFAAVAKAITIGGDAKVSGKGAVFTKKTPASTAVIEHCITAPEPLLEVVGTSGKTQLVRPTRAGFLAVVPQIDKTQVADRAIAFSTSLPPAEQAYFLLEVAKRADDQSVVLLTQAVGALEAAERASAEVTAAKRRAEDALFERFIDIKQTEVRRLEGELIAARATISRFGGTPSLPVSPPAPAVVPAALPPRVVPVETPPPPQAEPTPIPKAESPEDMSFRRQVARRLVSSWLEAVQKNKIEGRQYVENAIANIRELQPIGEPGDEVEFDGKYHQCPRGASPKQKVRVVQSGWVLDEENGDYVVLPAQVE